MRLSWQSDSCHAATRSSPASLVLATFIPVLRHLDYSFSLPLTDRY